MDVTSETPKVCLCEILDIEPILKISNVPLGSHEVMTTCPSVQTPKSHGQYRQMCCKCSTYQEQEINIKTEYDKMDIEEPKILNIKSEPVHVKIEHEQIKTETEKLRQIAKAEYNLHSSRVETAEPEHEVINVPGSPGTTGVERHGVYTPAKLKKLSALVTSSRKNGLPNKLASSEVPKVGGVEFKKKKLMEKHSFNIDLLKQSFKQQLQLTREMQELKISYIREKHELNMSYLKEQLRMLKDD